MTQTEQAIIAAAREMLQAAREHDGDTASASLVAGDVYAEIEEQFAPLFAALDEGN